jgi:PIN domain nuclease of toxin-antitoxin system
MSGVVADTHSILWYLFKDSRLSAAALHAMLSGDPIMVSSISLVEITYLIEKGRIPADVYARLVVELVDPLSAIKLAPLDLAVAEMIGKVPRDAVPDLPDRIIAATALAWQLPLVTRDRQIQATGIAAIW